MERENESLLRYLWRHRTRVAVSVVALAVGVVVAYTQYTQTATTETTTTPENDDEQPTNDPVDEHAIAVLNSPPHTTPSSSPPQPPPTAATARSPALVRSPAALRALRETLKAKVTEAVDVAGAVRRIKESTAHSSSGSSAGSTPVRQAAEARLWEHVKVQCLTAFFLAAYTTAAVDLHFTTAALDTEHCLFERGGLVALADELRRRVTQVCTAWTVRDKVAVSFEEVHEVVALVRRRLPPAAAAALLFPATTEGVPAASFTAALDATFRLAMNTLRNHAFATDEDHGGGPVSPLRGGGGGGGGAPLRTPPLASLLPQLNGVAQRVLSSGAGVKGSDTPAPSTTAPTGARDGGVTPPSSSSSSPPRSPARRTGEGHVGFVVRVLEGGGERDFGSGAVSPLRFDKGKQTSSSSGSSSRKPRGPDDAVPDDGRHEITDWALKYV